MSIRRADGSDWPELWPIIREIAAAGETFPYDRDLNEQQARELWIETPPGRTVVAVDQGQRIVGSAKMGRNRGGPGSHVATASFMVAEHARGRGVGRALGQYALSWAREEGFLAMQFNAVVEVNSAAVRLWKDLGFSVVGTVPEAFDHPTDGLVGLHVMHRYVNAAD
ncbi:GNAT family N-acetyltransferase [Sphingosinicella sp. CPCC 101087]|uniref:GNAT family N-acetyltransferase n=1 Tax=Sphingosinicella sp. CPCC 101087 TaxID=2497754 RepID=UPI00197FE730|nr:GNAT family N-acetyltransferase [Sphingosinicella sp. CPCC 101087]